MTDHDGLDDDRRYAAVASRDARFDGLFIVGVASTGIYCRPSCPAPVRPKRANVRFFPTAAAAQAAGLRACKRCAPDAVPGSPQWDLRGDLAARAMRLVADGVVDRDGVGGLAAELAVSPRHLRRVLRRELGATPVQLARAERARTARVLIETTRLPFRRIAPAAGFGSVRQFNATVRTVFDATPTRLRERAGDGAGSAAAVTLRLPFRPPFDADALLGWLAARAVPGLEVVRDGTYRRVLRLPHGHGVVALTPAAGHVRAELRLASLRDLPPAVARCRRLLDLDADPAAIAATLGADPALAAPVSRRPGLRVPGTPDPFELCVRAVVGQQISVAAATTMLGRLVAAAGPGVDGAGAGLDRAFPTAVDLLDADLSDIGVTGRRRETLATLATAVATGRLRLTAGSQRDRLRAQLRRVPGIGPWTSGYVALRALRDPDAFPAGDVGLRRTAAALGLPDDAAALRRRADRWRPWRGYAAQHLWTHTPRDEEQP